MTSFFNLIIPVSLALGCYFITTTIGQQCPKAGVQCDKCNVVLCPSINGTPMVLSKCSEGFRCEKNGTSHQCVPGACNDPNIPREITCTGPGFVPSPYKCDVSYFCTEAGGQPSSECTCSEGEFFDTKAASCTSGTCPRQPAICNATGEQGTLDEKYCFACDPNMNALLYECGESSEEGAGAAKRSMKCGAYSGPKPSPPSDNSTTPAPPTDNPTTPVPPTDDSTTPIPPTDNSTTPIPPTDNSTTPTPPNNGTTPAPPPLTPLVNCQKNGQRFPDPADCKSFFKCNATMYPVKTTCTSGRYEPARLGCIPGNC